MMRASFINELMTKNQALGEWLPEACRAFHRRTGSSSIKQLLLLFVLASLASFVLAALESSTLPSPSNQSASSTGNNVSICVQSTAVGVLRIVLANTSISQIAHHALRFSSASRHDVDDDVLDDGVALASTRCRFIS